MEEEELILTVEFCRIYQVEPSFLETLGEYGLIEFKVKEDQQFIPKDSISELEKFIHLHYDLDINMAGLDAIHHLLQKLNMMQQELNQLKNRLSIYE